MDKENHITQTSEMNITTNPGSLKAKLNQIESILGNLDDEMNVHRKEVDLLKNEKENLQEVLKTKTMTIKDTITLELDKIEEEMKKHFS